MIEIFIINLEKHIERKQNIINIFNKIFNIDPSLKQKINLNFIKAFDGNLYQNFSKYDNIISRDWYDTWSNRSITRGEIGCTLSHLNIWKIIITNNFENSIILEDDIFINNYNAFVNFLNIIVSLQHEQENKTFIRNYDFFYLSRKKISTNIEKKLDNLNNIFYPEFSYWANAYYLSLQGAKLLYSDKLSKNIVPVDEYIPYIYGKNNNHVLDTLFGNFKGSLKNIGCFQDNIISQSGFQDSSTYFSSYPTSHTINNNTNITTITVASDLNDAVKSYHSSCRSFGINPVILGLNKEWKGTDMSSLGGGQKVILLKQYIDSIDWNDNHLILFTDSYDVICNNNINIIKQKYINFYNGKIVFATENFCWPSKNLSNKYPIPHTVDNRVKQNISNKFLNSGLFMGYAKDIKKLLLYCSIKNNDDDQLYYTKLFFSTPYICLDYLCELFLCLNTEHKQDNSILDKSKSLLKINSKSINHNNIVYPCFIHGNGGELMKIKLNNLGNYLVSGRLYNSTYGYKNIQKNKKNKKLNLIMFFHMTDDNLENDSISIENFLKIKIPEYFDKKIVYFNQNQNKVSSKLLSHSDFYISNKNLQNINKNSKKINFTQLNDLLKKSNYTFYINSRTILSNTIDILDDLFMENKNMIGPMLKQKNSLFSNFWGDLNQDKYYARSFNYIDICNYKEKSCWVVPYLWFCFLIKSNLLINIFNENFIQNVDMNLCQSLRKNNIFINVLNRKNYGYLQASLQDVKITDYSSKSWEQKYLDKNFLNLYNTSQQSSQISKNITQEISRDIWKIKIFTKEFCQEIIDISESDDNWSKGGDKYYDNRISNYEPYPTQDIHLEKLGLKDMWEHVSKKYIYPIVENIYDYYAKKINICFVVKYSMSGQKHLKPHHDSSSFTINLCLNNDFEGGGCNFIRNNFTTTHKDIGSVIIHPGRITHRHQGLPITKGNRYVLISFVN